jgi:hypothetical protein
MNSPDQFVLVYPAGHACTAWGAPSLHSVTEYRGPVFQNADGPCTSLQAIPTPGFPSSQAYFEPGSPIDPASVLAEVP